MSSVHNIWNLGSALTPAISRHDCYIAHSQWYYMKMASRAREKKNKSPCSRCWPSGHTAGKLPLLRGIFFFCILKPAGGIYYPPAVPSGAAQGVHYPAQRARWEIFKLSLPTGQSNIEMKSGNSNLWVEGRFEG